MIAIITDGGTLALKLDQGKCVGCRRVGGGMAAVHLDEVGSGPIDFVICGNCIRDGIKTTIENVVRNG